MHGRNWHRDRKALHETGAKLHLTVRNVKKGEGVVKEILDSSDSEAPIELLEMDLSSLKSVRSAADHFLSKEKTLNVLVNNAGVMACPFNLTEDGFEMHIGTNHFGHFLFFQLLKATLLASSCPSFNSRVINVSSAGHCFSGIRFDDINFESGEYSKLVGYGQSKIANAYMANSIDRHFGERGLHAFSLHPGVIATTELGRHMIPDEVQSMAGADAMFRQKISKTVQQGAATSVWAAVSPDLEGKGGLYLSDVGVARLGLNNQKMDGPGYADHAYDEEAEERLWKLSCKLTGAPE